MAYDIFLAKTIQRETVQTYWGATGDSDWQSWTDPDTSATTNTLQVELNAERVERYIKKNIIVIMRGRSYTQYSSQDNYTQLWDFKRIEEHFKVDGMIKESSWTNLNTEMKKIYDIVTDGGVFFFYWHYSETPANYFKVDAFTTQLIQDTSALMKIEFHLDLVRGVNRE